MKIAARARSTIPPFSLPDTFLCILRKYDMNPEKQIQPWNQFPYQPGSNT